LVSRNQRERLIAAMAEVCPERGYGDSSVADVAKRAGVSTASFYKQFKDKCECMLVSFEALFERLLEEIERAQAAEPDPSRKTQVAIRTAAELLASDPPTAQLLSTETLAIGPAGVRLQHEAIERLAALLRQSGTSASELPDAAWSAAAAMVSLVGKRTAEGAVATSQELEALVPKP